MSLTEAELEQRRQAPVTHGMYAFEERGQAALDPTKISRLAELRSMVKTQGGRRELKLELLARTALLVEIGFERLRQQNEEGKSIWEGGVISRLGSYMALVHRLVDSTPNEDPREVVSDEIDKIDEVLNDPE